MPCGKHITYHEKLLFAYKIGKRIREAEFQKNPLVLVVGEKEQANRTVNVRSCEEGAVGEMKCNLILKQLSIKIVEKS